MTRNSQTLHTPGGNKVRYQGKRRYVLVNDCTAPDKTPQAKVLQRSDNLATLRTVLHRKGAVTFYTTGERSSLSILDTVTGQEVT